ncbi:MAG: deoxynucleoside kinase [Balneolaceae bacterium]|nr:deoxynucleoside kinase [Balneolaceae bacterium]
MSEETTFGNKDLKFIAIAGNIGAGKSSLTRLLAKHFGWESFFESVDDNPYLADFYDDMHRWSFNLQIYFLSSRFRHQKKMIKKDENFVQDRTIYEDVEIFAKNLPRDGADERSRF